MIITKESYWYRVFTWCLKLCSKFLDKDLVWKYRNGSNLCHFMRVIFIYSPLILLSQLLTVFITLGILLYVPIIWFGALSWFGLIFLITAGTVLIVAFCYLMDKNAERIKYWYREKEKGLMITWIKAKKQKICPLIKWEEGENNV